MKKLLELYYIIPLFLGAVISLKSFKPNWPKPYRYFSVLLIITIIAEAFAIVWGEYLHKTTLWSYSVDNHWIYNYAISIEYALYIYFFSLQLQKGIFKKYGLYIAVCFLFFGLVDINFIENIFAMPNNIFILGAVLIVIYILLNFKQVSDNKNNSSAIKHSMTWILIGALLFQLGSISVFVSMNYIMKTSISAAMDVFSFVNILNFITYTLYIIAFLCKPDSQK
jgi:hypothetical protein